MPLHIGEKTYPHLRDYIRKVKKDRPDVKDPAAYASVVARSVEPGFDKAAAAEKRRKKG